MLTGSAADGVYRDSLMDELRRIALAVVEGERQLAELEVMRETQQRNERDRHGLRLRRSGSGYAY